MKLRQVPAWRWDILRQIFLPSGRTRFLRPGWPRRQLRPDLETSCGGLRRSLRHRVGCRTGHSTGRLEIVKQLLVSDQRPTWGSFLGLLVLSEEDGLRQLTARCLCSTAASRWKLAIIPTERLHLVLVEVQLGERSSLRYLEFRIGFVRSEHFRNGSDGN